MSDWDVARVCDVCEQVPVGTKYSKEFVQDHGRTKVIDQSQEGIFGWHDNAADIHASPESPVFTFANHTCSMRWMDEPFSVIQNVFPMRGIPGKTDTRFLYYASGASVVQDGYKGHFPQFRESIIQIPPLPEQKKIAEILSGIDKAIDNQQNEIEKVSTIHRITCQEKIGELSQKSATTTIGSISNKIMDYRGKSPPKKDKGVPLITAKNIRKGFIDMNPAEFIQEDLYEEWMAKGVPVPGDILITTEAPLGNVAIAPPIKFAIGQRVICISPNRARIVPEFLLACMKTDDFQKQLTASSTGSTVSGVRQGVLLDCKIPLPDIELQIKIGNLDLCAIEMISILTLKKAKLSILKQSIASDLLSGRKRVSV